MKTLAALAVLMLVLMIPARASASSFSQGFEVDTSGWFPGDGTANREADGYVSPVPYANGIASAAGTHHARLRRATCDTEMAGGGNTVFCEGAFTRWGGYNKDWTGGYTTQVDVYFDVAYAIANPDSYGGNIACLTADPSDTTCEGTRFDFSSAINDSSGNFLRDFVFNVGTGPDPTCPTGGFVIAASTNAFRSGANPYNPSKDPFCIATSGWYTLRHTFKDVGGSLVVDMDLMQGNTLVHHWSIDSGDAISGVGCNRYGWFANEEIWDLAIDNSQMTGCGVEVTQCDLDGWEIANFDHTLDADIGDTTTASGTDGNFVSGPATPPLGTGSFQEVVGTSGDPSSGDDATRIRTSNCNGTLLSDVASLPLSYWTYVTSFGSGGQATYIQLRVDQDGNGTTDDILFFEPVYQNGTYSMITGPNVPNQCDGNPGCVLLNTWQFWDARIGGWWSNNESAGGPPLITLADYAAEHPGVKLATDTPSLRLTAGFGGAAWAGFNGATDDLTACGTTYNFELGACSTTSTTTTTTSTTTTISSTTTTTASSTTTTTTSSTTTTTTSSITTTTTSTTTSTTLPFLVDHFQCYEIKPKSFPTMSGVPVEDQFGQHTETVRFPHRLCAPADKRDEFPDAPTHPEHLIGHKVSGPSVKVPNQTLVNQFGTIKLDVVKPDILMVPTLKSLAPPGPGPLVEPTVDHFQCYKVKRSKGAPKFQKILGVKVDDQFGTAMVDLVKPTRLCAPANKRNEDPTAPAHPGHLLCYKTKNTAFGTVQTFTNSQFGPADPLLIHRRELCVPSLKNPGSTTTSE